MLNLLTILIVVVASLLRSMDLLAMETLDYEQLIKFSDPLVQLPAVCAVFIATKISFLSGVTLFIVFILLTMVWTFSLLSMGAEL
jgi:hypothetical protein